MKKRIIVLVSLSIVAVILSAVWYTRAHAPMTALPRETVRLTGPDGLSATLSVEIADTPDARETGLMHRTELAPGTGMLFIFESELPRAFWMKNTLIPLDILFFRADGSFVSRAAMEPCEADPCRETLSDGPAMFALEVNQGEQKTQQAGPQWRLTIEK